MPVGNVQRRRLRSVLVAIVIRVAITRGRLRGLRRRTRCCDVARDSTNHHRHGAPAMPIAPPFRDCLAEKGGVQSGRTDVQSDALGHCSQTVAVRGSGRAGFASARFAIAARIALVTFSFARSACDAAYGLARPPELAERASPFLPSLAKAMPTIAGRLSAAPEKPPSARRRRRARGWNPSDARGDGDRPTSLRLPGPVGTDELVAPGES